MTKTSPGWTDAAWTRTSTSPSPNVGVVRRAALRPSGGPYVRWTMACIVAGGVAMAAGAALADMADAVFLPQIPPDQYPHLNEVAVELMSNSYDPADEFVFGLDLILDALKALRR